MAVEYFLVNDTAKEKLHLDNHTKAGPIRFNNAVHCAFVNYMFEHLGESFRIISDSYDECLDYKKIDLLHFGFREEEITNVILSELKEIYPDGN